MVDSKQVNALLRKSWAYQRKNICMNVCVLLAPVAIAILLGVLQRLIDTLLADAKCGCECIRCEINGTISTDSELCNNPETPWVKCKDENKDNCGPQYSDTEDIPWCAIPTPSKYPPLFDLNNAIDIVGEERESSVDEGPFGGSSSSQSSTQADSADDSTPSTFGDFDVDDLPPVLQPNSSVTLMYTAAQSPIGAQAMGRMVRQPDFTEAQDPEVGEDLVAILEGLGIRTTFDLSVLSVLGWDIGSDEPLTGRLYADGGLLQYPLSMVPDCSQLQSSFSALVGTLSQGQNITEDDLGFFNTWINSCVNTRAVEVASTAEIDENLFCTWDRAKDECGGEQRFFGNAFDWKASAAGSLDVDVYQNDETLIDGDGIGNLKRIFKPIDRVVNTYLQSWLGDEYRARMLSNLEMPQPERRLTLDFSSFLGPLFFTWLVQLPLPWATVQLVYEKQHRLRMMMRMHGLANNVYILVQYLYFIIQYIIYIILMIAAGAAAGLEFFRRNTIGVQIVFYLLYGNVQVATAFLASCFFQDTRTANVVSYIWLFGSGLFGYQLLPALFVKDHWWDVLLELIPTFGLFRGLWELGEYSFKATYQNETGMAFSDINKDGNGMLEVWIIFLLEWPIFMFLAWYLEQVFSSGTGIRKHWLFPFQKCFGGGKKTSSTDDEQGLVSEVMRAEIADLGNDVYRERERAYNTTPDSDHPIVVRDLRKVFPPQDGNPEKVAVRNMSLAVQSGECFGLLGPNGAGKSTSINMMIGFLEAASESSIYIDGKNIREEMNDIYKLMGVCPQHDLLWESLTAREHLSFYARLKGLTGSDLTEAVDDALRSVKLFDVANKRAGQFSGGMKRRLSVAISLIGSPKVTYLDEPSTGLDPASRRQLWAVVSQAKKNKAVVLTTHSMEEAEFLCDRLGIFIDGKLACLGNPKQLTARYGGYYVFTITVPEAQDTAANAFVMRMAPAAQRTYGLGGTSKYEVPTTDIQLSGIFDYMATASDNGLTVLDWGVHNASLEDVFIRLAQATMTPKDDGQV